MRMRKNQQQTFDKDTEYYYMKKIILKGYDNIISEHIWNIMVSIYKYNMNLHLKFMRINFFASIN